MGPGGRSSAGFACCENADSDMAPRTMTPTAATDDVNRFNFGLCNMDLHLIDRVVEITARIPSGTGGLGTSLRVGCARENSVVSTFRAPIEGPEAPGIAGLIMAEGGGAPTRTAIGRNLDLYDVGFACPRGSVNRDSSGF